MARGAKPCLLCHRKRKTVSVNYTRRKLSQTETDATWPAVDRATKTYAGAKQTWKERGQDCRRFVQRTRSRGLGPQGPRSALRGELKEQEDISPKRPRSAQTSQEEPLPGGNPLHSTPHCLPRSLKKPATTRFLGADTACSISLPKQK